MSDLAWLADLDPVSQDRILKELVADERCVCDHLDDDHDADGVCLFNNTDGHGNLLDPGTFATPHFCFAYNPIQQ